MNLRPMPGTLSRGDAMHEDERHHGPPGCRLPMAPHFLRQVSAVAATMLEISIACAHGCWLFSRHVCDAKSVSRSVPCFGNGHVGRPGNLNFWGEREGSKVLPGAYPFWVSDPLRRPVAFATMPSRSGSP